MTPQLVAGLRHDLVAADPETGAPRRLTTYAGTIWFAPPPDISSVGGLRMVTSDVDALDPSVPSSLFLPDSLPYPAGTEATVTATGALLGTVDQTGTDATLLYPIGASLAADLRGGDLLWVGLEVRGRGRLHAASYTVWVSTAHPLEGG